MNVYALVAEVLVVAGLFAMAALGVKGYNQQLRDTAIATDRAASAESAAREQAAANAKKDAALAASRKLAAQRDKEKRDAELALHQLAEDYAKLALANPDAAQWLSAPVPAAVRSLRHGGAGANRDGVQGGVSGRPQSAPATPGR